MKTIKFRAWSIAENKMFNVSEINWDDRSLRSKELKNPDQQTLPGYLDYKWYNFESVKLMLFTGLTDKNGREIYEGDILKQTHNPEEGEIVHVIFVHGSFAIADPEYPDKKFSAGYNLMHSIAEESLEVIGNTHKNPELLEVE